MFSTKERRKKIAVLRGGPGREYDSSLDTGAHVLMSLESLYDTKDIVVDKEGRWIVSGKFMNPDKALWDVDMVFNALHGSYGEGGTLQEVLEAHSKPYSGSSGFSSLGSLNKHTAKKFFKAHGLKTPAHHIIKREERDSSQIAMNLFSTLQLPLIVKPVHGGGSKGLHFVSSFNDLADAIEAVFEFDDAVIVEEYIKGEVISCGVVENYRGKDIYSSFPVHTHIPNDFVFKAHEARNDFEHSTPAKISLKDSEMIQEFAKLAHGVLGLRHYSESDFILSPGRGIFLLETNALPYLGVRSPFIAGLDATGTSRDDFVHHILSLI